MHAPETARAGSVGNNGQTLFDQTAQFPIEEQTSAFCQAYADCYTNNSCDTLQSQIRQIISSTYQCRSIPQSAAEFLARSITASETGIAQAETEGASGPDGNVDIACRQAAVSNFNEKATACEGTNTPTSVPPPPKGGDWVDWIKWGAIALAATAAALFAFAKALKFFNRAARAAMDAQKGFLENLKYFFRHPVADTINTFKFIFSGDWLPWRQEEQRRRQLRNTQTISIPSTHVVDPIIEPPQRNIVLMQLGSLERDPRYREQGLFFASLDPITQLYLAQVAVDKWYEFVEKNKRAARREIKEDNARLPGAVPFGHIEDFAINHLIPQKSQEIKVHASNWERRMREEFVRAIRPDATYVENQFATAFIRSGVDEGMIIELQRQIQELSADDPQRRRLSRKLAEIERRVTRNNDLVKFYSMKALYDWPLLTHEQQIALVDSLFVKRDGVIQDIAPPNDGELPMRFIRATRQNVDARKIAPIFVHLLEIMPELEKYGFEIIYTRAEKLLRAFEWLPKPLQEALGGRDWRGRLSDTVMELTAPSLNVGTTERLRLVPSSTPWKYDPENEEITSDGINISRIKNMLVRENEKLAMYPEVLDRKARALYENWSSLSDTIKAAFTAQDRTNGAPNSMGIGMSITYIKFWLKINSGIGVTERPAIEPGGGGSQGGGTGGTGGTSGGEPTPSLRQAQVMPIPNIAQSSALPEMSNVDSEMPGETTPYDVEAYGAWSGLAVVDSYAQELLFGWAAVRSGQPALVFVQ